MKNKYDPAEIKKALMGALSGICSNIYPDRPKQKNLSMGEFIVLRISNIDDKNAFGETLTEVKVFVKDIPSGPDDKRISLMTNAIEELLPIEDERHSFDYFGISDSLPDDTGHFHFRTILLDTKIIN